MKATERSVHVFDPRRLDLAADPYRPLYHFLPPANWMNDPNGAIFWGGRYHFFYQYNPNGAFHGTMHWGHTVTDDLVHWTDLPVALTPDPDGPDRSGCASGTVVPGADVPTLIYYGMWGGNCIATSDDDLVTWTKNPANPVIPHPPEGTAEWRPSDPCAWREGDEYYSLSRGRIEGVGDTAFLFRSDDLVKWDYLGRFYEPGKELDCAVPDFFSLGRKHMLLFASHRRGAQYYIGSYDKHKFVPEVHGRMNYGGFTGGNLLAGITLLDGKGRRIFIGWISEGRSDEVQRASGWAGVMSLPRVLSLRSDGTLGIEPVPELNVLRREHSEYADLVIPADSTVPLPDADGECIEVAVAFGSGSAEEYGIKVRCAPDGSEETVISYKPDDGSIALDVERSSLSKDVEGIFSLQRGPLSLESGELLQLRVFVDRSVVEVFANGRQCLTKRIYPSRRDSLGIELFAKGGDATASLVDVWRLGAVWPDAL